ncbi:hypothetical protein A0J61_03901 [Choanephora cucurbitarum]|uniref:Uncharacterized protein n=1 Tax=Choanephora cucurbitarum TaxID=101091 RepID=A0A1C7NGD9_9FUNG|nr:hypothetical protein A0J61_03901 [Choanephora cucurbitarum]
MNSETQQEIKAHKNNLDKYYEYRIYDRNIGDRIYDSPCSEYAPCPIVVMSRHQGFLWNDELFVSAYRRKAGYECHKSTSLKCKEDRLKSTCSIKSMQCSPVRQDRLDEQDSSDSPPDVIEINLTEADCDVWP